MKQLFLLLIILFSFSIGYTQQQNIKSSITGTVIDAETQQALPYVNIWFDGTTRGTTSDEQGVFKLEDIPVGRYVLMAKMVGYEQISIPEVVVVPKRTTIVDISLYQSYEELEEVEVRPKYFRTKDDQAINSMTSISLKEIKRTPGVPDMFRRLQSVAGVNKTADNSAALIVRGGAADENLTIIENVEIYSPFHFSSLSGGMAEGISIIQPKIINNVSFMTGGFNSRYGDKLSSVTEIQLQKPAQDRINTDITVDVSGFGAIVSGPITPKVSWLVSGRRSVYDLMMKMRNMDYSPQTIDVHSKFVVQPNKKNKFIFYGMYVSDQLERIKSKDDLGLDDQLQYRNITKNMLAFGVTWKYLYSQKGYIQITPYLNTNQWKLSEGRTDEINDLGQENAENFAGLKAFASYRFNYKNKIIAGSELKHINTQYEKWTIGDTLRTGVIQPAYNLQFGPENAYKTSAYFHYFYSPYLWLRCNAGLRIDYFNYTDEFVTSPRLGFQFIASNRLKISASYGLFAQYPPFYRIFLDSQNKTLKTNKAWHYILGFEYLICNSLQLKTEGFYKDLRNLAVAVSDTSRQYFSTGTGNVKGVEFSVTKKMSKNFYFLFNYTYSKSVRKDSEASQKYDFDFDSPHIINLMGTYNLGDWWNFSLSCRYATGTPFTPYDLSTLEQINGVWNCNKGEKNSERLPDYFRIDLRVDRCFIFNNFNITTFVEIWNVTNHDNIITYDYSDDFLIKEPVALFSLMPMIGLSFEF